MEVSHEFRIVLLVGLLERRLSRIAHCRMLNFNRRPWFKMMNLLIMHHFGVAKNQEGKTRRLVEEANSGNPGMTRFLQRVKLNVVEQDFRNVHGEMVQVWGLNRDSIGSPC